jgi:hypothetical protein
MFELLGLLVVVLVGLGWLNEIGHAAGLDEGERPDALADEPWEVPGEGMMCRG